MLQGCAGVLGVMYEEMPSPKSAPIPTIATLFAPGLLKENSYQDPDRQKE